MKNVVHTFLWQTRPIKGERGGVTRPATRVRVVAVVAASVVVASWCTKWVTCLHMFQTQLHLLLPRPLLLLFVVHAPKTNRKLQELLHPQEIS